MFSVFSGLEASMPQRATDLQRPRRGMERSLDQPRDAMGSPYVVLLMPAAHPRLCMRAHLSALALTIFTSLGPSYLALPYPHLPPPESKHVHHRACMRSPPPSSMLHKYEREQQALLPSPRHPHHANVRVPPPSPIAPLPPLCNGDDEDDMPSLSPSPSLSPLSLPTLQ